MPIPEDSNVPSRIRMLGEAATALGVILGLLFVGVEIRANTAAVQGATLQAISDQSMGLSMQFVTDEHLVRLMPQILEDSLVPSDFGPDDRYRLNAAYGAILRVGENRFQQTALGTVPESGVEQFGRQSSLYSTPYLRAIWPSIRNTLSEGFVQYLEATYGL